MAATTDRALWNSDAFRRVQAAVYEVSWLLSRGYSERAVITLVGDRHQLVECLRTARFLAQL